MPFEEENKCPICKGTGFIFTDNGVKKCECLYKSFNIAKYLNIPKRFWKAELQHLKETLDGESTARIYAYLKRFPQMFRDGIGLFLVGEPGVGKTYVVSAILKYLYRKYKIRGLFVDTKELSIKLKDSFNSNEPAKLVEALIKVPLLVLDDLGNENLTDWYREVLTGIISKRYNDKKVTFVTSNYYPSYLITESKKGKTKQTPDKAVAREYLLDTRFGSHMVSRLGEMSLTLLIKGKDQRMEKVLL